MSGGGTKVAKGAVYELRQSVAKLEVDRDKRRSLAEPCERETRAFYELRVLNDKPAGDASAEVGWYRAQHHRDAQKRDSGAQC